MCDDYFHFDKKYIYEVIKLLSAIYENIRRTNRYKSCVYLSSVESIDFLRLSTGQGVSLNRQALVKFNICIIDIMSG